VFLQRGPYPFEQVLRHAFWHGSPFGTI
jgi:hypothetical protein